MVKQVIVRMLVHCILEPKIAMITADEIILYLFNISKGQTGQKCC